VKALVPLAQQPRTKPSSKSPRKSTVLKAQSKSRPPRKSIARSPKTKPPPKEGKAAWIDGMEKLLADVRKKRSLRRDPEEVYPKEEALKVAIQARLKLEDEGRREKNSKEELLDELEELFGVPKERLRGFLNGDRNNLIKVGDLTELTDKWKTWLSSGSVQGAAVDIQRIEDATARIDGLESSALQESASASVGLIEDAVTDKMPIEDAAEPSVDLGPSTQQESAPGGNTASDNAATKEEPIEGGSSPINCSEPLPQQESASVWNRASGNVVMGEKSIEDATSPIDGLEPSPQQGSVPGETRATDNAATGEEPIEDATSPIDGSEPSAQQESFPGETRATGDAATGEELIEGATTSIAVLEPSAHQESASVGTITSEQAPSEQTHLIIMQRVKEMASNESRRMENAKRKHGELEAALAIWTSLVEESNRRGTAVDDLVSRLAAYIQKPEESLRTFLHGNANDAMNTNELEEFATLCQEGITDMMENVPISRESMPSSPKKQQRLD
jgi:hypothetical protein